MVAARGREPIVGVVDAQIHVARAKAAIGDKHALDVWYLLLEPI